MIDPANMPEWAAIIVAVLVLAGALITMLGTIGLARFADFYERIHAPTLGSSLGAAFILLASSIYSTVGLGRPVLHEFLVFIFILVTTPVTLMLLARATLYRDKAENNANLSGDEAPPSAEED
jgi:multicomponent K+:H+ antiporter subunit G